MITFVKKNKFLAFIIKTLWWIRFLVKFQKFGVEKGDLNAVEKLGEDGHII